MRPATRLRNKRLVRNLPSPSASICSLSRALSIRKSAYADEYPFAAGARYLA